MSVLAVDPGGRYLAYAFFVNGRLDECGLCKNPPALRLKEIYSQVTVDCLVVEGQFVYPGPQRKNPNSLLPVAETAGAVKALFCDVPELLNPKPKEWKGSKKKELFTKDIQKLLKSRVEDEDCFKDCVSEQRITKKHQVDVLDAIGLGYWYYGLIGVRR